MFMIDTIKPYGSVNIRVIKGLLVFNDKLFFVDNCGKWEITQETYEYLKERGIPLYERKSPTTESL